MGSIARSGTWDEASSPAATRLARRFEEAWRAPRRKNSPRPDPADFLPDGDESPPAAWLALLRVDLNMRWDEGEAVRVEEYRDRYPVLDADTLVALCYEEFCRREEDGRAPFPAEYDERFPDLADRLRRVFDIHELVGNAESTDLHIPEADPTPFPEAGQTIAGFHLVEELGRGSFARVFLARERQLADRPVALKVARTGSREPQTLARLQHTHIVPVHSYRTDPITDLHLLCMPFFGRVTLARLLADPAAKVAPTGAELLAVLDRLEPSEEIWSAGACSRSSSAELAPTAREASTVGRGASSSGKSGSKLPHSKGPRAILAKLPFDRAIAWWGARLAEALAHAHDRGVLHRDIKPSNVLVTGDGLPMLLDFNLAGEPWAERKAFEPDHLGGTLAYMAPEHLEAVADGGDDRLDARADIFSLGVLLFEALAGSRPFPAPSGTSVPEALRRAAEDRRGPPPRLREDHPEVPASLERVIRRCLAPDPLDRFPSAAELAADLQAVADDAPLRSTREPILVRAIRRARRSWRKLILAGLVVGSAVALATSAVREGDERLRVESTASHLLGEGKDCLRREDFATASARFDEVSRLTASRPELHSLYRMARVHHAEARLTGQFRDDADALLRAVAALRPRLIGPDVRPEDVEADLGAALAKFRVLADVDWARRPALTFLDAPRRARLLRDVDEILFLFAVRLDPRAVRSSRRGIDLCERALAFTDDPRPWRELRAWFDDEPAIAPSEVSTAERSAKSCFERAVLLDRMGRPAPARAWLDRAVWIEPGNAWYRFHLATLLVREGRAADALPQYEAALAIDPASRLFRLDRARALRSIGEWARAEEDEKRAGSVLRRVGERWRNPPGQ